jgi:nicotinamidase/pyrazinamidase
MKALIVVDAQYDFMPGGALPVPEGDLIIKKIIAMKSSFDKVIFTQDWHPENHCSFKEFGGPWPTHCVQNTHGAALAEGLYDPTAGDIFITKGIDQNVDSYSGFWDNERKHETLLNSILKGLNIDTVYICGLATNFCVKFTALDAIDARYKTFLITEACRGIDINPGDVDKAIQEMQSKGIEITPFVSAE